MELREALAQVSEIHAQMARSQVFRGYRSATTAFSATIAVATACAQAALLSEPLSHIYAYLLLWVTAAALCMAVVGIEMIIRVRKSGSKLQSQLTLTAVEQFLPALVGGGLLTGVLVVFAPETLWMLPGLWLTMFGLGIFASNRVLPRATFAVGGYYLLAGMVVLILTKDKHLALSPWAMGVPFGVGQLLTAGLLYWTLERGHAR